MKIEKNKPKKGVADLPTVTKELIAKLQGCPDDQLTSVLQSITVWRYGKCELYHWIDVLNRFDEILEAAAVQPGHSAMRDETTPPQTDCIFLCPQLDNPEVKDKVLTILNFTSMLIEHSYSRYIYNSTEHLCVMLGSPDLDVVLAVLNLFYVFSKRSNFITRLPPKKRSNLNSYLEYLGETWGGKQNGFGLAECCQNVKKQAFPEGCTTVYFEYQPENDEHNIQLSVGPRQGSETMAVILEDVDMLSMSISQIMAEVTSKHRIPQVKQMQLLTHLRLAKNFSSFQHRLKCVMARLQALSVLVYSTAPQEVVDPLIYEGFVEELVEVLEIRDSSDELVEIKAAVLRTLTAIIHLERDPRLNSIIEATGATSYHGFLPTLVRESVTAFITGERQVMSQDAGEQPLSFATSLFSFLYHMATYETTGDALVSSGIMESLLQVLDWKAFEPMNITLVTRAVRVIDLITGLDISAFHSLGGWDKMLSRLEMEVSQCKEDAPTILPIVVKKPSDKDYSAVLAAAAAATEQESMNVEVSEGQRTLEAHEPMDTPQPQDEAMDVAPPTTSTTTTEAPPTAPEAPPTAAGTPPLLEATGGSGSVEDTLVTCMPERVALIKSILNFLKKVIPESTFAENIRNLVDSSLPESLKHLVSNAEYYGPSIYLPATEVITVFIFHEPSQLSTLQDNGLPWVMLNSIINKHIPVTREVLASLPSILSALCLNTRGLEVFVKAEPFDHLFGVLVSPEYLPAMRKKKGTDQIGDTATNLGEAMDELMRHQPSLRTSVLAALVKLLKRLVEMGEKDIEEKKGKKPSSADGEAASQSPPLERKISLATADDSSDSEKEDEEDGDVGGASGSGQEGRVSREGVADSADSADSGSEKSTPPVTEYIVNVVRFLDAILSQNNTDDHMQEFIKQGGLEPMIKLLAITPLAAESTYASANTAIVDTCKNILQIARAPELFVESMTQLSNHLKLLEHFLDSPEKATSSVLLDEVGYPAAVATPPTVAMPILHCLVSVNEFIQLFVHLARASQAMYNLRRENVEFRVLCVNQWSTTLGLSLLKQLSRLYRALVWEGFILLAVAANEDSKELESDSKISIPVRDPTPESGSHSTVDEARTGSRETSIPSSQASTEAMDTSTTETTTPQPPISTAPTSSTEQMDDSDVVKSKIPSLSLTQPPTAAATTPSLTDSLKQLTPLLTITSRVGRSLAELMNLLIRLSTSPLYRTHRRGPGHTIILNNYQPPSEDAIAICTEVTNLLVESMNWEVPMPRECSPAMQSPIRDWLFAGMTFKMYAVDFCELVLFDEQKQALHLMMHSFDKEVAMDALVGTFHSAMKIVDSINQNGSLLGSCIDFLEAWLNLAEKLANSRSILYSPHAIPLPPTTHPDEEQPMYHPLFNPLAFVIKAQKALFPCIKELWKSPQLPKLSPKVVELLLSTASHFYRSEDILQKKLEIYFFDDDEDFLANLRAEAEAQRAARLARENAQTDTTNTAASGGGGTESGASSENSTAAEGTTTGATATSEATATANAGTSTSDSTPSTDRTGETSGAPSASETEATGTGTAAAGTSGGARAEQQAEVRPPRVDPLYLGQLCDMGFSREQAERALLVCGNDLPTAMEWILNRHPTATESTGQMSEDEQIMQAIALSLGQDVSQEVSVDDKAKEEEEAKKKEKEEKELQRQKERELMTPVSKEELDEFSDILLAGCLELCVSVNDSVVGICDLLSAVGKRNEDEWREKALVQIKEKVMVRMRKMCEEIAEGRYTIPSVGIDVDYSLILFLTLCMEEMPIPCARCVCDQDLLSTCINLCQLTQSKLCPGTIPRWLCPLLLLLEMWEATAAMVKWASYPKKYHLIIWQSFENNRWITYSHDYSQMLEHAYQRGERSVFLKTTRTRYENNQRCVVQLRPMLQVNPDTGMQRPILRMEVPKKSQIKTATPEELYLPPVVENPCPMSEEQSVAMLRCSIHLLSSNLDPDTLHSNLRLCLRLTRNQELASIFVKEGGPQAILSLTHKSAFRGFASFATLIFRHCLDDSFAIKHAVDIAMKTILTAPPFNPKEPRIQGTGAGGARARDLYYVFRRLGSFACRCPELVSEAACKYLGLSSLPPRPEHYIVSHRVPPTPIKLRSTPKYEPGSVTHLQTVLINMLIDHLCAESFSDEEASKSPDGDSGAEGASGANDEAIKRVSRMSFGGYSRRGGVGRRRSSHRRQITDTYDDDDVSVDMAVEADENGLSRQASSASAVQGSQEGAPSEAGESLSTSKAEEKLTEKPLISKVAVLRILAEIVDSYPPCAKLIADSSRKIKIDGQPPKDMTVLAFIFDHLLPASVDQVAKIPPIASLAKTFLQHIATSNHCPDAIAVLVTEFKAAFVRSLSLPESRLKHNRIRALTGLLSQITDYITASRGPVNPCHFTRLLIRKGIISDLARAPHSLNLNSSMLTGTVNSILKPLEALTKIVIQVASSMQRKAQGQKVTGAMAVSNASGGSGRQQLPQARILASSSIAARGSRLGEMNGHWIAGIGSGSGSGSAGGAGLPTATTTSATAMVTESGTPSTVNVTAATSVSGAAGGGGETTTTTVSAGEPSTVATPSSQTSTAVSAILNQDDSQPSTSATATVLPEQGTPLSQDDQNISSILEATHESLIPLEEDPHDLEELVADEDMEHHQLLSEVAHLARELGRVDQVDFVNDIIEEAIESVAEGVGVVGGDSGEEGGELGIGMEDASMEDSDLASVSDDEDEEDDDEIYEDNCNSAGEEVEDDEYDNSHLDTSREEEFVGHDFSDAESTQDEEEEEEEEEEEDTEVERSAEESGAEDESTAESSDDDDHDAHSSDREDVDEESHGIREDTPSFSPLALGAGVLGVGVEGEDVEEMEEEEGDDDVLDFEYEFDDDDDEGTDYDLSLRDADIDLHPHGALPSLFTRAFHSRPTQPTPSDLLEQTSILSRLLPMQHPLLVHRTDYQIHHSTPQTPGGAGGGPGGNLQGNSSTAAAVIPHVAAPASTSGVNIGGWGNDTDPQQTESAMQQLLTNISAATGSSELLGFGVGGSTSMGAQRARSPPQGNSANSSGSGSGSSSSQQQQIIDDGLESPTIPSTFTRWEEESAAIDGHMPIVVMRALREDILQHWMDEYEKENAPKEDQNKTSSNTASASGSTSASSVAGGGEQSGTTSSTSATAGGASGAGGQSTQGEGGSSAGATVGDSTPGTITVPNPSDEATPSSHSPRDGNSVVDQLRSGLRQVADALAQTVAAVRSTRDQLQLTQRREEITTGATGATSGEGTSGEMAVSEPPQRDLEGEEGERQREGEGEEESRGEEMESQSAAVSVVEAMGVEELSTPMEEGPPGSTGSVQPGSGGDDEASALLSTPHVQEQPQQDSAASPVPSPGGSQSQSATTPTTTPSTDILPTFDGSQASAVATLANMDPQHPMYTYISAVAGAPAPPTASDSTPSSTLAPPTTSPQASQLSPVQTSPLPPPPPIAATMTTPPTTGVSPRLPVFAQFQQQADANTVTNVPSASQSDSQSSIPMSVIQDARLSSTTASSSSRDEATGATPLLPPQATPTPMGEITPANIESLAADVASQVSSFFAQSSLPSREPSTSTLPNTASLADHLAEELARAVSQLVPTSSSSSVLEPPMSTSTSTTASTTASSGSSLTVQSRHLQPQSMQSPSPSDTLAPLLSSLQMPQGGNGTGTGTETTTATEIRIESGTELEANIERETPANFVTVTSGATFVPPSAAVISLTPSEGELGVAITQVQIPHPPPPVTIATPTNSVTTSTSATTEASASNSEARMDTSSSQNAGGSSSAQTPATPLLSSQLTPSNQQGESSTQAEGQGLGDGAQAQASASSEQNQLPDIDPSFLAALPDSIRQEVVAQHEREQRRLRAQREGVTLASTISPEFLAALPLNIQEEVIQQERVERAQQEARQANPTDPIDNAAFFYNLPRELRRTILADMDDSLISHLPEDIATEARQIRQERDTRRRQMMEQRQATFMERLMEEAHMRAEGMPPPSWHHLDSSDARYSIVNVNPSGGHHHHHLPFSGHHTYRSMWQQSVKAIESGSKQMLDQEALTCLLVLLFLDQNKLHNNRLHRIVKNVSQHQPTRAWILSSLLAIIRETSIIPTALPTHPHLSATCPMPPSLTPKQGSSALDHPSTSSFVSSHYGHGALVTSTPNIMATTVSGSSFSPQHHSTIPHWLNLSINAALGSHAKVFRFEHSGKVGPNAKVHVHPLAAVSICGNVLELLIFLARQFPSSFLPSLLMPKDTKDRGNGTSGSSSSTAAAASSSSSEDSAAEVISNFWQVLLKLDGAASRKGKGALKSFQYSDSTSHWQENEMFSASIMGQLMALFQNDLIRNSITLTDKLLRALSVASSAIPKAGLKRRHQQQGDKSANLTSTTPGNNSSSVTIVEDSNVTVPSEGKSLSVSQRTELEDVFEPAKVVVESSLVDPQLVKVLVGVLTSGRCSEDGLEDATVLLTNLSKCSVPTRELILITLLDGVKTCGETLCSQISSLFEDLILNMETLKKRRKSAPDQSGPVAMGGESSSSTSAEPVRSATGPSRFGALAGVILPSVAHEQQHVDRSKDLHLPSMLPLHCKGSQQSFFLRMLKVVCQLRESAQAAFAAQKRAKLLADVQVVPQIVPDVPPAASSSSGGGGGEGEGSREVPAPVGEGEQQQQEMDTSQGTTTEENAATTTQSEGGEPSSSLASSSSQQATQSQSQSQAEGATVAATPTPQQTQEPESDESQQDRFVHQSLSHQLELDDLWSMLSECLSALAETQDPHAVLVLQPSVEAFFLVHADHSEEVKQQLKKRSSTSVPRTGRLSSFHTITDTESNPASPAPALLDALSPVPGTPSDADFDPYAHLPPDTVRFLKFAEKHRTVLNQILRQSTIPLSEGPFAVLVNHTRVLDFDIKRRYFRHELDQMEDGLRRDDVVLHIRRDHIFEDSFRELYRRTADELKGNLYIQFQGEEGQDVGGLLREWYLIMAREMFNPNYALFKVTPGDQVTYMPNPSSHVNPNHLDYFKFIGRVIAKAIYDNKLLDAYFTRSFYKHILGKPVHFTDMEAEDYTFYQSMLFLLEHNLKDLGLELTFSMEIQEFGKTETKDMKPDGQNIPVTEENKKEYVQLACQMKMTSSIRSQIKSFLEGFYEIIPKELISIFNEQELELLICGLPTIDIDNLKANTEYHKYTENSMQIQWFWRALRSFDQADRASFIQFVTGTSKVPLQGFAALEGMNGVQKFQIHRDDRSTDRLPCAHTCFNQLDLPPYETYDKLHHMLLTASRECPEGFGFA